MTRPTETQRHLLLTFSLSSLALLLAVIFRTADRTAAALAMVLSTLGDLALMDFRGFFSKRLRNAFVCGGLFFMLSHVVYAAAYLLLLRSASVKGSPIGTVTALLLGAAAYLSLLLMSANNKCFGLKKSTVLFAYAAIAVLDMAAVFSASFALAGQGSAWRLCGAAGILSFLVSDYFIGMDRVADDPSLDRYIWAFYPIGQLLLIAAA